MSILNKEILAHLNIEICDKATCFIVRS